MQLLQFPSSVLPAPPKVTLTLPDNWAPICAPGSILAARKEDDSLSFRPNVMVTWVRHPASFNSEQAASIIRQELMNEIDAVEIDAISLEEAVVFAAAFRVPDLGTIAQFHAVFSVARSGCNDILHLTSSIAGDRVNEDLGEVREIMRTILLSTI